MGWVGMTWICHGMQFMIIETLDFITHIPAPIPSDLSLGAFTLDHTIHQSSQKPTHFHREQDVYRFYPDYHEKTYNFATQRKRPGGESVIRMAQANDKLQAMLNENAE